MGRGLSADLTEILFLAGNLILQIPNNIYFRTSSFNNKSFNGLNF